MSCVAGASKKQGLKESKRGVVMEQVAVALCVGKWECFRVGSRAVPTPSWWDAKCCSRLPQVGVVPPSASPPRP